jgi:3-phosphoshikimate 1-carboxyvinyltransferase
MEKIVFPAEVAGEIEPPSSKSYAQRAIAAALLANGTSTLSGIGAGGDYCDDTASALRVVQALGAQVQQTGPGVFSISGGFPQTPAKAADHAHGDPSQRDEAVTLNIGESGLSTRLFSPIAALCPSPITVTGHGTILKRPMDMMIGPLRSLGVEVADHNGHLPITVRGPMRGGEVDIDGSVSSQFLTGLLMALPLAERDTTVRVRNLRSIPYIDMTIAVMDRFGIDVDHRDYEEFYVPGAQSYKPTSFTIEGDWSAASCLLVAGAIASPTGVTLRNLNPVSLQADVAIIEALSRAGAHIQQTSDSVTVSRRELNAFEFNATDCPDLFPALAALAAACEGTSVITGTSRLTHKESDRARAIQTEYQRLGIDVDISEPDIMRIIGQSWRPLSTDAGAEITVDSHGDHRMAMSLAVAALRAHSPITITGAECVSKSYANFWRDYELFRTKL